MSEGLNSSDLDRPSQKIASLSKLFLALFVIPRSLALLHKRDDRSQSEKGRGCSGQKECIPTSSSRSLICLVRAGCEMKRRSEARVMFPVSQTVMNDLSTLRSMFIHK